MSATRWSLRTLSVTMTLVGLMMPAVVQAAAMFWDGGATDGNLWGTAANWATTVGGGTDPGAAPGVTDSAQFNITGLNGAQTIYLDGERTLGVTGNTSLTFSNTGATTILGGTSATPAANNLAFTGDLIVSSGAGAVTIGDTSATPTAQVNTAMTHTALRFFVLAANTTTTITNLDMGVGIRLTQGGTLALPNATANTGTANVAAIGGVPYNSWLRAEGGSILLLGNPASLGTGVIDIRNTNLRASADLSGANKLTNTLVIATNSPTVGGANNIELGGDLILSNGAGNQTLNITNTASTKISGTISMTDHLTAIDNQTLTINVPITAGPAEISGLIQNRTAGSFAGSVGTLTKAGAGTLVISGANNTYSGPTNIGVSGSGTRIGVLRAAATQALGTGVINIGPGGNDATARLELIGGILLNNNITFDGRNTTTTTGIQSVSGNNTLSGNIGLNSGGTNYYIQSDADLFTISGSIANANNTGLRIFTLTGAGTGQVTGLIHNGTGSTGLIKLGTGTWIFTNANTYTGGTTITEGVLRVDGDNSAASGPVSVGATGTLAGSGTVGGAVSVSGVLAPGASAESLDFASSLSLASGSVTNMEVDGSHRGVLGGYDAVNVATALTYGGTLNVAFSLAWGERSFDLFDFATQSGDFSAINLTGAHSGSLVSQGGGLWAGNIGGQDVTFTTSDGVLSIVPEPASVSLLALGCLLFAAGRSRQEMP